MMLKRTLVATIPLIIGTVPALALDVSVELRSDGSSKPTFIAMTNLPDGTELELSLEGAGGVQLGQDKATVEHGRAQFGPFSDGGEPMNVGTFAAELTSGGAVFQPQTVQAAIGDHGQKLRGSDVVEDPSGLGFGRVIDKRITFTVR